MYAHNAQGLGAPVNAAGRPLVSYVADKVADIWSQPYGSGPCTGCHATNLPPPNLVAGAPAGYTGAKNEGALIYPCVVNDPACAIVAPVHAGFTLFGTGSVEYRALVQWVADGNRP